MIYHLLRTHTAVKFAAWITFISFLHTFYWHPSKNFLFSINLVFSCEEKKCSCDYHLCDFSDFLACWFSVELGCCYVVSRIPDPVTQKITRMRIQNFVCFNARVRIKFSKKLDPYSVV